MSTTKEELVASSIRKQIAYLEGLLNELTEAHVKDAQWNQRIRDIETKLRQLRQNLGS